MKVLHISCSDQLDSASRAANALHCALLDSGVDSQLLVMRRSDNAGTRGVSELPPPCKDESDAQLLQQFCFDENQAGPMASSFQIGYPGAVPRNHPALQDCDLIHLHQVAGMLSPGEIRQIASLGKPVIWSLPDFWAFTGGCFHPGECQQFRAGCSNCPQLRDDSFHLPASLFVDKMANLSGLENLTLIAPDAGLALMARQSAIFGRTRVEQISPVCPGAIAPVSPKNGPLRVIFALEPLGSAKENARLLRELLEVTQTYGAFRPLVQSGQVILAAAGIDDDCLPDLGLPLEIVKDGCLNGADLLVFPKPDRSAAILEAVNQGIPVLAFKEAGIQETVEHRQNGWLLDRAELRPMAEALCFLVANPELVRTMAVSPQPPPPPNHKGPLESILALYRELLQGAPAAAADSAAAIASGTQPNNGLDSEFRRLVRSIAAQAVSRRDWDEKTARLASAEKRLAGTEQLIAETQKSLAKIESRQQRLIKSGELTPAASKELGQIQKSAASLRNKLKWRGRRLRIYNPANAATPSGLGQVQSGLGSAPVVPQWAQLFHRLFLKKHWMKHGKKDQYPPRPIRPEAFPKPKLRGDLPRMAIVTPSFMQGNYLEATIRSIVDQNYPNLAYAVQDGGSSDSSLEVIQRYADRLTLWASQPDSGQARAIVSGFEKISGEIMAWVNSDDMLVPGALRYIGEYFAAHPEVDAIYGNRIIVNENGDEIARWVLPPHHPSITPYIDPVPQETLFWRKSLWEKVGGLDPSFRFALDWDLVLRFQRAGANLVRLPYFLGCFRVHSQQKLSARAESIGAEEIAYLRQRETGGAVSFEQLEPYKRWMEISGAVYSRLLEFGIRL